MRRNPLPRKPRPQPIVIQMLQRRRKKPAIPPKLLNQKLHRPRIRKIAPPSPTHQHLDPRLNILLKYPDPQPRLSILAQRLLPRRRRRHHPRRPRPKNRHIKVHPPIIAPALTYSLAWIALHGNARPRSTPAHKKPHVPSPVPPVPRPPPRPPSPRILPTQKIRNLLNLTRPIDARDRALRRA